MNFKTKLLAFYDELKNNLNNSLTLQVKTFKNGYQDLANAQDVALLFLVLPSTVEQVSSSHYLSTIPASIVIQIKKCLTINESLLLMVEELTNFIIANPNLGGVTQCAATKWEIDMDESTGILALDLVIEI